MTITITNHDVQPDSHHQGKSDEGHTLRIHDVNWLINPVLRRDGDRITIKSVKFAVVGTEVQLSNGGCFLNPPRDETEELDTTVTRHDLNDEEQQLQHVSAVSGAPVPTDSALASVARTAVEAGHVRIAKTLALFGDTIDVDAELREKLGTAQGRQASVLGAASQVSDFDKADRFRDRLKLTHRIGRDVVDNADLLKEETMTWLVELARDKHHHISVAVITETLKVSMIDLSGKDFVNVDLLIHLIKECESSPQLLAIHIKGTPAERSGADALWKRDITANAQQLPCVLANLLSKMPDSRTASEVVNGLVEMHHLNLSNLGWKEKKGQEEGGFPMSELTALLLQPAPSKWKCLRSLDVSGNRLGFKRADELFRAIKENATLTKVRLVA